LTLGEQQHFCLGRRFSKHKMTRYAKSLRGAMDQAGSTEPGKFIGQLKPTTFVLT